MVKSVLLQFEEHDRRILWIFVAFFIFSLSLYIYFLGVSVFAVIERKGAEQHSASLTANIMSLESRYVTMSKRIDLALAHERGFVEITAPVYVSGAQNGESLSLRTLHDAQ
jgi:hypothetical protein